MNRYLLLPLFLCMTQFQLNGQKLADIFQNQMVYQRQVPFQLYGTAPVGKSFEIRFQDQVHDIQADQNGKWSLSLPKQSAGGPHSVELLSDSISRLDSIFFGEVWLASGQSNMAFPLVKDSFALAAFNSLPDERVHLYDILNRAHPAVVVFDSAQLKMINDYAYYHPAQWTIVDSAAASNFSAIGFYFAQMLADSLDCKIGIMHNAVGGSNTESWIPRSLIEQKPTWESLLHNWMQSELVDDWVKERAAKNLEGATTQDQKHPYQPGYLFQAGIRPLTNYPLAGIIWYQGESNAADYELHEEYFTALVQSWRAAYDSPELPFLYVQLSSMNRPSWPVFRYSQLQLESALPNLGMVVSSDLGHPTDVHPSNKRTVGYRLGLKALDQVYGFDCLSSGPRVSSVTTKPFKMTLHYSNVGDGLYPGGKKLTGFELAGPDGQPYPAKARIKGNTVVIRSCKVRKPVQFRYGWQPFSLGNLYNAAGLPASTDQLIIE